MLSMSFDLMTSAQVRVNDKSGREIKCRMLMDTCSSANFITESLSRRLNTPKWRCPLTIGAMNELCTTAEFCTEVTVRSVNSSFSKTLTFFIVPLITEINPNEIILRKDLNIPKNIKLADPEFHKASQIDLLIGSGPTLSTFCTGQIKPNRDDDLILQKTKFGWIIGGTANSFNRLRSAKCLLTDLQFDLEKFWSIEEVDNVKSSLTKEELGCEKHFEAHVRRDENGRYIVALPFRDPPANLGDSRAVALKRLLRLQKRFKRDREFELQYTQAMEEYVKNGHMILLEGESSDGYFLPHQAVIKKSSNTTKVRIVFDGSAKSSNGTSLNDHLLTGPTIQDDLTSILMRFRKHRYVVIADIEKMFLQFLVRQQDWMYQKVLWFYENEIREFAFVVILFGEAPSPYLAIRSTFQLADDEKERFPIASDVIKRDFYVDNMLTGSNSKREAREICHQISGILQSAGLNMRQWASNDPHILDGIAEQDLDAKFKIDMDNNLKTLGMYWKAKSDKFVYEIREVRVGERVTKRGILSEVAKIFDPLGLLGPIVLFAKKIIQDLWQAKVDWDESVPNDIHHTWISFCSQLHSINNIAIDRQVLLHNATKIEIHGFCDASDVGYGACIYVRSDDGQGHYKSHLLCSKSRVAPLKKRSIPRLELCGMQLLAHLYEQAKRALQIEIDRVYFWSDSSIALNWIQNPSNTFKTFVSNRVADIQLRTEREDWHHIRSHENPADKLSRGQQPNEFLRNDLWFHGPRWLTTEKSNWPKSNIPGLLELPEKLKIHCLLINQSSNHFMKAFERFSSYAKLVRIVAIWLRFAISICPRFMEQHRIKGPISMEEYRRAERSIVRVIQAAHFGDELRILRKQNSPSGKNRLVNLDPLLDENGIMRVGGRIHKAALPFSTRHPIILPRKNHVTELIIKHYHVLNQHSGIQTTLYAIREKFWPFDGRSQVRGAIHKCITCFRANPRLTTYKMGDLPEVRIQQARPFKNVGIDYCGYFYIKEKKFRNKNFIKCYVAIFICMVTKAVHIEIVEDLSTDAFMGALRRFIARRGLPANIYSDNATNFKGAENELNQVYQVLESQELKQNLERLERECRVQWHFIPPRTPNFGGLWEAAVKRFKHHFKRVACDKKFTFSEFYTFSVEIEAILNSRPLTPMSDDVNDMSALTPAHFLIGESMKALPEHDCKSVPMNRLNAWEIIKKIRQDFWSRWHKEYLTSLNVRYKQTSTDPNLKKGLLVLIKDDEKPSMEWNMGRIEEIHPGTDGIVRAVTVKTANGSKKRGASKIAVLPTEDNDELWQQIN